MNYRLDYPPWIAGGWGRKSSLALGWKGVILPTSLLFNDLSLLLDHWHCLGRSPALSSFPLELWTSLFLRFAFGYYWYSALPRGLPRFVLISSGIMNLINPAPRIRILLIFGTALLSLFPWNYGSFNLLRFIQERSPLISLISGACCKNRLPTCFILAAIRVGSNFICWELVSLWRR